ncbi:MAG: tetratricopeptide repeat protein [Bryobacter sp.]|nr:tetratricopeptide repeat protein [Bryobacter sp.]
MQKSNTKSASRQNSAAAPEAIDKPTQQSLFENAMHAFHQRDFLKAKELFDKALLGPVKELHFTAKQHALMCEKRLASTAVQLDTAEDYYNYGVSLYNQGKWSAAQEHLQKALSLSKSENEGDHVHYALALAFGMGQDWDGAVRHLSRAIELQSRNRNAALNDPDFQELLQHPSIKELLIGAPAH